ncbi:PepSY domain-containing protein [Alteromonas gilva]|uniref:PepSY domain-containing protein n=1 Tax=Alteromonas gilva TaxID=2987522 RepID=A0ABT5L0W9_9ALTE|nr:PepSY domain-containing protein [Alteromonas gilva]MDC8830686.1 PepSY domain-containing protein [Alteromonas gilva]
MLSMGKARASHKWLMRIAGLQFVIWSLTGLYMVAMDIHFIHGESLSHSQNDTLTLSSVNYSLSDLLSNYPDAGNVVLTRLLDQTVYRFRAPAVNGRWHLVSADNGRVLPPISQQQAAMIARQQFTGTANIDAVRQQIPANPAAPGKRSLWIVTFDDIARSTFYIHQHSGEIVRRRHSYWHAFDWAWRFHIMDYDDGENVTNLLLRAIAILGLLAALSGVLLLAFRLTAKWRASE